MVVFFLFFLHLSSETPFCIYVTLTFNNSTLICAKGFFSNNSLPFISTGLTWRAFILNFIFLFDVFFFKEAWIRYSGRKRRSQKSWTTMWFSSDMCQREGHPRMDHSCVQVCLQYISITQTSTEVKLFSQWFNSMQFDVERFLILFTQWRVRNQRQSRDVAENNPESYNKNKYLLQYHSQKVQLTKC